MTRKPTTCLEIEPALIAAATSEADTTTAARVEAHTRTCASCRGEFASYRAIDRAVGIWREAPSPVEPSVRERLETRPAATRAVAQALRWNPLPIVVPCHRVIGLSGALTGYAGDKLTLKQRLLSVEGVPAVKTAHDFRVPRDAMYVRSPDGSAYCLPSCTWIPAEPPHGLTLFGSPAHAEAARLEPCADCHPDIHPISR